MSTVATYELPSEQATKALAARFAPLLEGGDLVVLSFFGARGVRRAGGGRAARNKSDVSLAHEFSGRVPIAHADLYRLRSPSELVKLGLDASRDEGRLLLVDTAFVHGLLRGLSPLARRFRDHKCKIGE